VNYIKTMERVDINDDYESYKYGDLTVIVMKKNGYINMTKIHEIGSPQTKTTRSFQYRIENARFAEILRILSIDLNIPVNRLLIEKTVDSEKCAAMRGTYAHPQLLTVIALWISADLQ
jgi:hypothetical protein